MPKNDPPPAAEDESREIPLPYRLGRDKEAREGLKRELWVSDASLTDEPIRFSLAYTETDHVNQTTTELGWFDIRPMVRKLAEFAPDLVVMRREDVPEVEITDNPAVADQLAREREDHEETRAELRAMTKHARKGQQLAAIFELMDDANAAELIIDGIRITPVTAQ